MLSYAKIISAILSQPRLSQPSEFLMRAKVGGPLGARGHPGRLPRDAGVNEGISAITQTSLDSVSTMIVSEIHWGTSCFFHLDYLLLY